MTTKDVIKTLPIEEQVKLQILNMYDYMEPAQKLSIERLAWKTYDLLYEERLNENTEKHLQKVIQGEEQLGNDFSEKVAQETDIDMEEEAQKKLSTVDLAAARRAMKQIVDELASAKKAKTSHK